MNQGGTPSAATRVSVFPSTCHGGSPEPGGVPVPASGISVFASTCHGDGLEPEKMRVAPSGISALRRRNKDGGRSQKLMLF